MVGRTDSDYMDVFQERLKELATFDIEAAKEMFIHWSIDGWSMRDVILQCEILIAEIWQSRD